jgi:hypothetical protein
MLASVTVACLLGGVPPGLSDLDKINRTIGKPPVCKGRPKYCLLAFGPRANFRVWLVLDGETLFVDRNGNGDLTEPGEKVTARTQDGDLLFEVGDLRDGNHTHRRLRVGVLKLDHLAGQDEDVRRLLARDPKARGCVLSVEVDLPGRTGNTPGGRIEHRVSFRDARGFLRFADRPDNAPVIHLGGAWQVTLADRPQFRLGRETDLHLVVGTPGIGPGTTAFVAYAGLIPENAHPTAEVVYPPAQPGEKPVKVLYELKERC